MVNLPFIGKLNTVFVVAVAIGMGIILMCMVLNIINSVRSHDMEKIYFDTNGVAGFVFYLALTVVLVLYMTGNALPATFILVVYVFDTADHHVLQGTSYGHCGEEVGTDRGRYGYVHYPGDI